MMRAMRLSRRSLLAAGFFPFRPAIAQDWPARPIRIVLAGPPGGIIDVGARAVSGALAAELGTPVVLDHRPGAGGMLAAQTVVAAPADGYTLLLTVSEIAAIQLLSQLPFDLRADLTPIATIGEGSAIACVSKDLPVDSLAGLVAFARAHPGAVNYLNPGNGTRQHLIPEQINHAYGVQMTSIPYRGLPPGIGDLVEQRIQLGIVSTSLILQYISAGTVKPIAFLGSRRLTELPTVPTMAEQDFGDFYLRSTLTLFGPRNLGPAIVDRTNAAVEIVLTADHVRQRLRAAHIQAESALPATIAMNLAAEQARLARVIRQLSVKSN